MLLFINSWVNTVFLKLSHHILPVHLQLHAGVVWHPTVVTVSSNMVVRYWYGAMCYLSNLLHCCCMVDLLQKKWQKWSTAGKLVLNGQSLSQIVCRPRYSTQSPGAHCVEIVSQGMLENLELQETGSLCNWCTMHGVTDLAFCTCHDYGTSTNRHPH